MHQSQSENRFSNVIACLASCVDGEYRLAVGARPGRAILVLMKKACSQGGLSDDTEKAFAKVKFLTRSRLEL